ncbi:hypothetical protein CPB83DRAFT_838064 [Crepidotus variabilis]|uniref:Uncharacterized protein n=1 Tax=Crepidotus variabilis TaxID=179855 RepID=A0A9P6JM87_9AGAR|nr:hypothetical protein CPB83DRAFT_838064 [Crepidotus variabilis]
MTRSAARPSQQTKDTRYKGLGNCIGTAKQKAAKAKSSPLHPAQPLKAYQRIRDSFGDCEFPSVSQALKLARNRSKIISIYISGKIPRIGYMMLPVVRREGPAYSSSLTSTKVDNAKREEELRAQFVVTNLGAEARSVSCPICKETLQFEFLEDEEEWAIFTSKEVVEIASTTDKHSGSKVAGVKRKVDHDDSNLLEDGIDTPPFKKLAPSSAPIPSS